MSENQAQSLSSTSEQGSGHTGSDFEEAIKAMEAGQAENGGSSEDGEQSPEKLENKKLPVSPPDDFDFNKIDERLEMKKKAYMAEKKYKDKILNMENKIRELEGKSSAPKPNGKEMPKSESEIYNDVVNDPGNQWMTSEEMAKKVKEEIRAEMKKESEEEKTKAGYETEIIIFKEEISDMIDTNPNKYPLTIALGEQDQIFDLISQDFNRNVKEYGQEYAQGNIMAKEKAAQLLENYLAQQMKTRLKSKGINKALRSHFLSDDGEEESEQSISTQSETPRTLSNSFGKTVATNDDGPEEWNARVKWATKFIG